jgi:hypothetical protein
MTLPSGEAVNSKGGGVNPWKTGLISLGVDFAAKNTEEVAASEIWVSLIHLMGAEGSALLKISTNRPLKTESLARVALFRSSGTCRIRRIRRDSTMSNL